MRPTEPVFMWDFDRTPLAEVKAWAKLKLEQYDIYESSENKYHLVALMQNFDQVQHLLRHTAGLFTKEQYIQHCRRLRLRVSAKWDSKGREVIPAPRLIECHCNPWHTDKRTGMLERYFTK